ncbi:MAG TPA: hypothetical protein VF747_14175 [Blastocatellia bacterium]|jgi:hypothetical protein
MSIYLNANSSANGQSVTQSASIFVIELSQVTVASQPGMWNAGLSAFVAPAAGVYRVTGSTTFSGGNNVGDGVILGFSVNQKGPWPPVSPDLSTTNVIVIEPGFFIKATAQSVTALLKLNQGDTVQLALAGIDNSRFGLSYSFLTINSL